MVDARRMIERFRLAPPSRFFAVLVADARFWGALLLPTFIVVECVAVSVNNGWPLASALTVAGFLIGLSGLLLVALGLSRTRRLFGRPSHLSRFRAWGRDAVGLVVEGRRVIAVAAATGAFSVAGSASAEFTIQRRTLEGRIEELERRATAVERKIEEVRAEATRRLEETRAAMLNEDTEIRTSVAALSKRLEEFSVGGLDLEFMGLVWLMAGSGLSTFYERIAECSVWRVFL